MELTTGLAYIGGIILILIIGKIFIVPIKLLVKLLINSAFGALIIFIVNLICKGWGFHIGLNLVTALIIGLLGIPGSILVILLKLLI